MLQQRTFLCGPGEVAKVSESLSRDLRALQDLDWACSGRSPGQHSGCEPLQCAAAHQLSGCEEGED